MRVVALVRQILQPGYERTIQCLLGILGVVYEFPIFLLISNLLWEDICFDEVRLLTFPRLLMRFLELRCVFIGRCQGHRLHFLCLNGRSWVHLRLSSGGRLNVSPSFLWPCWLFVDWLRTQNIFHTFPKLTRRCSNCTPPTYLPAIAACYHSCYKPNRRTGDRSRTQALTCNPVQN